VYLPGAGSAKNKEWQKKIEIQMSVHERIIDV
jgi:hypothetical protein